MSLISRTLSPSTGQGAEQLRFPPAPASEGRLRNSRRHESEEGSRDGRSASSKAASNPYTQILLETHWTADPPRRGCAQVAVRRSPSRAGRILALRRMRVKQVIS